MELAPIFEPGFYYGGSWVWENNVSEQKLKDFKIGKNQAQTHTPKTTSK